jgi:hypothetical protein
MSGKDTEQRYFLIGGGNFRLVSTALWALDDRSHRPRTKLNASGDVDRETLWTEDLKAQPRLRQTLVDLGIRFEEGPDQQVRTWLENFL